MLHPCSHLAWVSGSVVLPIYCLVFYLIHDELVYFILLQLSVINYLTLNLLFCLFLHSLRILIYLRLDLSSLCSQGRLCTPDHPAFTSQVLGL